MSDSDAAGKGSQALNKSGSIEVRKTYGGDLLPPGAVTVKSRILARYAPPGATNEPHGVPPIGVIGLPDGWVLDTTSDVEDEELRVLPFRFPFASRAYALRCGERLVAVMRNIQPIELGVGQQVVVQFNESRDWTAVFGQLQKVGLEEIRILLPTDDTLSITHENIQFVGKVAAWWDESAEKDAWQTTQK